MARGFLISEGLRQDIKRTIARVDGMPDGPGATKIPTRFESLPSAGGGKVFRVCTFTGAWSIGDAKTVTFKYQTATPNTASVTNLFFPVTSTATAATDCGIAKDGTAWFLIDVPFETATAVFVGSTSSSTVFSTGGTSVIRFFGTDSTSIITFSQAGQTSAITFVTGVQASLNTASCTISVTASTATASISSAGATQTATVVSMSGTQTAISVSMSGTQTITVINSTFTSTILRFKA
jgi:hypothetical protein